MNFSARLNNVTVHTECSPLLQVNDSPKKAKTPSVDVNYGVIKLSSSQRISYREHGRNKSKGIIVFYFGATNFDNNACPDMSGVLNRLNVRFIFIDRPGYGESTLLPERNDSPLLFAKNCFPEVFAHFDKAGNEKYFFIGYQIGCVYVLSIAHSFPDRINEICLVCPPTPFQYGRLRCCALYCLCCVFCWHSREREKRKNYLEFMAHKSKQIESDDHKFIKRNKEFLDKIMAHRIENEERVWKECFVLLSKDLGFSIKTIKSKTHLWYGTKDWMAPNSSSYLNDLQNCITH